MSRIGKLPVIIPQNVEITLDDQVITVTSQKGTLRQTTMPNISVIKEDSQLIVKRLNEDPETRAKHGLMRSLINNMVEGVSDGFSKQLELNGVGFRVVLSGNELRFSLGFSHDVKYKIPAGITISVEQNVITIKGIDKQQVGQAAAEIRSLKKPEPYKGKGIKYVNERIIRKSGKSGKEK